MLVNADFTRRVIVHSGDLEWTASPAAGVERKMLDRVGDEVARATTIVRFAPASAFARHTHDGGEEILVLEGVFQDEDGDYPAGHYLRNPPGSSHAPRSEAGCVLLVKLHQFDPADRASVRIDTALAAIENARDVDAMLLSAHGAERVTLEAWAPGAPRSFDATGGWEALVLEGDLTESGDALVTGSWIRIPAGAKVEARAGEHGAKLWVKSGHLGHVIGAGLGRASV